jgi:uncharacterized damage-inducible protein DinB
MTPPMLRQLRHDVWATEQLVGRCRALAPEQLDLAIPGTFGSVRRTLAHIVSADEGYLVRLLGTLLHDPPFRHANIDAATLEEISTHLAHVREGVERLFSSGRDVDGDRELADTPLRRPGEQRFVLSAWVPLTQFIHHGNDHRAQVTTTLSAHGIEPPDLQVWPYAMSLGASREAK